MNITGLLLTMHGSFEEPLIQCRLVILKGLALQRGRDHGLSRSRYHALTVELRDGFLPKNLYRGKDGLYGVSPFYFDGCRHGMTQICESRDRELWLYF